MTDGMSLYTDAPAWVLLPASRCFAALPSSSCTLTPCNYSLDRNVTCLRCVHPCRVRLVMLFALRYERDGRSEISSLIQRCQDFGMSLSQLGVVRTILLQAGADKCAPAAGPPAA
jgi:hypothetical protein